jgi:hypothetical protein
VTRTLSRLSDVRSRFGTVGSREPSPIDRLAGVGLERPDPESSPGLLIDSHLHSDGDEICPLCLGWIEERHYVRQNAYGLLQHEVCPPPAS